MAETVLALLVLWKDSSALLPFDRSHFPLSPFPALFAKSVGSCGCWLVLGSRLYRILTMTQVDVLVVPLICSCCLFLIVK